MLGKITKLASAVHGATVCQRFFERFRLFMGMHWEKLSALPPADVEQLKWFGWPMENKKLYKQTFEIKMVSLLSLARWSLCGWDSRHGMIDACDRRSETASYRTADWWSLGGGLLKFPGYVPLFWFMVPGNEIYLSTWMIFSPESAWLHPSNQWGDSMVFHEKNTCWNPSMINPKVVLKQSG